MRLDPAKQAHVAKLRKATQTAYGGLADFRRRRERFIRRFVGHNYRTNTDDVLQKIRKPTLVNLLAQLVETYGYKMTANNPRVAYDTEFDVYKPFATRLRLSVNRLIHEIDFKTENQAIVTDALFYVGIAHIHNGRSFELDFGGDYGKVDPGKPCIYHISLDDWFHDQNARCLRELGFCGHYYKKPLDAVLADPNIPDEAKDAAFGSQQEGEANEYTTPVAKLSTDGQQEDTLEPMVQLMDVWLPRERLIVSMLKDSEAPPLRVVEWNGVEHGPYRMLAFQKVPDNLMPLSTVGNVEMLHELYNVLMNQLKEQALQQKTIGIVRQQGVDDGVKSMKARNGEVVPVADPQNMGWVSWPGPDAKNQAFVMQLMQLFDRQGGNLPVAAGLGSAADTLGQEQMLMGQVSVMEAQRQQIVYDFAADCLQDIAYLHWHDQFTEQQNTYKIGPLSIPMGWTPGDRQGNLDAYTMRIEPYSMQYQSPASKIANLDRVMNTYVAPLLPLILQGGGTIDTQLIFDKLAEAFDQPWLRDIVKYGQPGLHDPNQFLQDIMKPGGGNKPNGNYTRRSVSQPGGQGNQQMQAMLSAAGEDGGGGATVQFAGAR
jgi:hypothetical protein